MQKIKLTDKEKKILAVLHDNILYNGKFSKEDENDIRNYASFSYSELHKMIKKFLKEGLLIEFKEKNHKKRYELTKSVTQDMVDKNLLRIFNLFGGQLFRSRFIKFNHD